MDPHQQMLDCLSYNVAVVDDFVADFDALRQRALEAQYDPLGGGMFATGHYSSYAGSEDILDRISHIVGV
ncbi:MAG TPA: hypothetical protein VJ748_04405, partial [Vitreimonas sp.]|nr:hypothetical protein [Vitreimonas sp.]